MDVDHVIVASVTEKPVAQGRREFVWICQLSKVPDPCPIALDDAAIVRSNPPARAIIVGRCRLNLHSLRLQRLLDQADRAAGSTVGHGQRGNDMQ